MKVMFPKATVYQHYNTPEQGLFEVQTSDGRIILFAFTSFDKAKLFCKYHDPLAIFPIRLDQDSDQLKAAFRPYCMTSNDLEDLVAIDPDKPRPDHMTLVKVKDLLAAESENVEVENCCLDWQANGTAMIHD